MNKHARRWTWLIPVAIYCLVAGCSVPKTGERERSINAESVTGITWEWTGTSTPNGQIDVATPDRYTIRLKRNGEAQIRYGCNHGGGLYEIAGGRLSFGPLTYTRIRCGQGSQSISYRHQLGAVTSFFSEGGNLYLVLPEGTGTMRFRKADGK